jgi:hypothetical protein
MILEPWYSEEITVEIPRPTWLPPPPVKVNRLKRWLVDILERLTAWVER